MLRFADTRRLSLRDRRRGIPSRRFREHPSRHRWSIAQLQDACTEGYRAWYEVQWKSTPCQCLVGRSYVGGETRVRYWHHLLQIDPYRCCASELGPYRGTLHSHTATRDRRKNLSASRLRRQSNRHGFCSLQE